MGLDHEDTCSGSDRGELALAWKSTSRMARLLYPWKNVGAALRAWFFWLTPVPAPAKYEPVAMTKPKKYMIEFCWRCGIVASSQRGGQRARQVAARRGDSVKVAPGGSG